MNILVDQLPEIIGIDGVGYPVATDFRDCLRVILAFEDPELTAVEKQTVLLAVMYPKEKPPDANVAVIEAVQFLNGGGEVPPDTEYHPRVYSFAKDANMVFSAFRQTHGIDLQHTEYLHWWVFLALFSDLGADTAFCQLTALRKRVKTGKASKEERAMAHEMGDLFDVPEIDNRSLEDREAEDEFLRLVEEGERARV